MLGKTQQAFIPDIVNLFLTRNCCCLLDMEQEMSNPNTCKKSVLEALNVYFNADVEAFLMHTAYY